MKAPTVRLGEGLDLPVDIATQTLLVVGKRGSGKSNTCVRLAEQLFAAGVPFVAVDPPDNWYGLKCSQDGKGPGLGVYVFGGRRADAPLEASSGALMADVIVEHRISAVLSVKHFSLRERARFVAEFAHQLFQRNTEPLHLFLEEAHEIAPQDKLHGDEVMVNRVANLVKQGRSSGIGVSAITQRPAALNKNVTTQAEILVVHRMLGPQDVAAIREWIKWHGEGEEILGELGGLQAGEAYIWAPSFPEDKPLGLRRVRMLRRETFDSGATPKAGQRQVVPKTFAQVDLDRLTEKMAGTIERAKADDPKELRARIAALQRETKEARAETERAKRETKAVEVPALTKEERGLFEDLRSKLTVLLDRVPAAPRAGVQTAPSRARESNVNRIAHIRTPIAGRHQDGKGLAAGERKILTALAQYDPDGRTAVQVAILTGYAVDGGGFRNYLGALRTRGLISGDSAGLRITGEGLAELGEFEALPTGAELLEHWKRNLGKAERAALGVIAAAHPGEMSVEEVAEQAGYAADGGGFRNALGRLRTLELVKGRGSLRASDALFG